MIDNALFPSIVQDLIDPAVNPTSIITDKAMTMAILNVIRFI